MSDRLAQGQETDVGIVRRIANQMFRKGWGATFTKHGSRTEGELVMLVDDILEAKRRADEPAAHLEGATRVGCQCSDPDYCLRTGGSRMVPANGPCHSPRCSKCGDEDINTMFHKGSGYYDGCGGSVKRRHSSQDGPHLHHTCRNCQWDWTGPTLDTPAPDAGTDA